jgi:trans-2,3-dihydro-3-hydroxyanthranilate isomerase
MRRRFATLDVFTQSRFAGNPLAVVLEPAGLDTAAMQTIAREFNLSETVFVFPPADLARRAAIRIFTPARELPFAGHPTVGTAVLLGCMDGGGTRDFVLGESAGPVPCHVSIDAKDRGHALFGIPKLPALDGKSGGREAVAAALGLSASDIGFDNFATAGWSAGVPFALVPLRGLEAIRRCKPDLADWDQAFGGVGSASAFVFCKESVDAGSHFHARMFAPRMGVAEDPATGSAVAAFAGLLAASGAYGDCEHALRIEQGYEMGRPSQIELTLTMVAGKLTAATIAGDAIIVSEGTIEA